jgi:methionine aminotransferase
LNRGSHVDWQRVRDAIDERHARHAVDQFPAQSRPARCSRRADLDALAELARRHDRHRAAFGRGLRAHHLRRCSRTSRVLRHPELAARSFVVSLSFGKTYHCTGWKLGYCVAPPMLSTEFRKVHQYLTFCTFNPAQWALADDDRRMPSHYLELPAFYQEKRDRFRSAAGRHAASRLLPVYGAYFQIVDYSAISDRDDMSFCEWLTRDVGVAAIPVSAFYETPPESKLIRFCFAKTDATLEAAAERLHQIKAG